MKNVNQPRKYGLIKWAPNGVIGQAAQVAVDRYVESLGATIRTGGSQDFVVANPLDKVKLHEKRQQKYWSALIQKSKREADHAPTSGQSR